LQKLLRRCFEIREQTHLLEDIGRQILCFIDDQDDAATVAVGAQQVVIQQVDQFFDAAARAFREADPQLFADREEKFCRCDARIQYQRDVGLLGDLTEEAADDGRLARADLTRELYEAARFLDAINEVGQRLRVLFTQEQITRVRRDGEGLLVEPEEVRVHRG